MPSSNQATKPPIVLQKTYLPVGLTPRQIVSAYNANQWEELINAWLSGLEKKYKAVQRFSGPGEAVAGLRPANLRQAAALSVIALRGEKSPEPLIRRPDDR